MSPGGLPRAPALVSLSRDHHDALVEILYLRRAQGQPEAAGRFVAFFDSDLEGHFADEEDVVLPAVETAVPAGVARIREEHAGVRAAVAALRAALSAGGDPAAPAEALAGLLHDHIRYEERVFFMDVQAALAPPALEAMGAALEAHRAARGAADACRLPPR